MRQAAFPIVERSLNLSYSYYMATITIYSTPWCTYCKMAKEYFQKNNVAFQEKDVAEDEQARDEMIKISGQLGVPVISVDEKVIVGFDKNQLASLLGIK